MNKKVLSLMIVLTMVLGSFSVALAVPPDVIGTSYEEAVERLVELEVITGYPDGTFGPNNNITRSEYAAVAVRAKQLKQEAENNLGKTIFGDVPANYWSRGYINVAQEKGLIKGMGVVKGVNKFGPELNITYEQAVTIILRAIGYESEAMANGGWPNGYLTVASQIGLLKNVNGSKGMLATRGMVAKLTYNALDIPNMVKVGSDYVVSGTQGTEEVYLFNDLRLINKAAASGNWGSIDRNTFARAGITGVTAGNIGDLKASLEALANGSNKNWSPSEIQGVFDTLAGTNKVVSAEAISDTQIQVEFNTKLDPTDAVTKSPYKLSISGVTFTGTPVLSADGKTLTFTANKKMNFTNQLLVVERIKTEKNPTIKTEKYTKLYSYGDPVVELVKFPAGETATVKHGVPLALEVKLENSTDANISVAAGDVTGLIIDKDGNTVPVTGLTPSAFVALKDKTVSLGTINNSIANVGTYTIIVTVKESPTISHTGQITLEVEVTQADISAAQIIIDQIDALGPTPTKTAVQAINYGGLTANQKTLVDNYDELKAFTDDIAAGITVEGLMSGLTTNKLVKDAREDYDDLGPLGKAEVVSYSNLTAAELAFSNAKAAMTNAIGIAQPLYNGQKARLDSFTPAEITDINTNEANGFNVYQAALNALKVDLDAAKAINLNADGTTLVAITGAEGALTAEIGTFNSARSIFDGLPTVISIGK